MYKQRHVFLLIFAAMLFFACLAGCAFRSDFAAPAASISETPARYETAPFAFLEQRVGKSAAEERLSDKEKEQLTALADLTAYMELCIRTEDLNKWNTLFPLYIYYQDAFYYDEDTGSYLVEKDIPYAPNGTQDMEWESYMVTSAENAGAFIRDVLGKEIPQKDQAYGDWEENYYIVFRDGKYYIRQGDYEALDFRLRAYQPLGDGIFYLSFDADDSWMSGPSEDKKGNMLDYCRLLVVRSDSAWEFTVMAKLKEGDDSLLPDDFPLPLYAA